MTGFLVVNHYLSGEKYSSLHSHLIKTAEKMNISLRLKTNEQMLFESERPDLVLFGTRMSILRKVLKIKAFPYLIPHVRLLFAMIRQRHIWRWKIN